MIPILQPGDSPLEDPIPSYIRYRRKNSFKKLKSTLWESLMEEGRTRCESCGTTKRLTLHHKIPLEFGGANDLANIQPLCMKCHKTAHKQLGIPYGVVIDQEVQ